MWVLGGLASSRNAYYLFNFMKTRFLVTYQSKLNFVAIGFSSGTSLPRHQDAVGLFFITRGGVFGGVFRYALVMILEWFEGMGR